MNEEKQRIAIAEACGWRRWQFGDPYLEGLRLADQKFDGYIRVVTRVYPNGVTLDVDESPLYRFEQLQKRFLPTNFWLSYDKKWWKYPPDYLNNLNAIHEAEKILLDKRGDFFYLENLDKVCGRAKNSCGFSIRMVMATAEQRAEALLKTIGKWES